MYLEFFNLKRKPFTLSPDPNFIYYSASHREAISQMIYSINEKFGFMLLTGEVGTGKTLIINALVKYLMPHNYRVGKISHKISSTTGLMQNICHEFGISFYNKTLDELFLEFHDFLKESYRLNKKVVLILDEAHIMGADILEHVRMLSNFEKPDEKYIVILLVGQPEIETTLKTNKLFPLNERINLKFKLRRLNKLETKEYILRRLKVAGYPNGKYLFSDEIINQIYLKSCGIPRRINLMCEKLLLIGYSKNKMTIG